MGSKLNKAAYEKLIDEDIKAIRASNCDPLEREHIVDVLRYSVGMHYPSDTSIKDEPSSQQPSFIEFAAIQIFAALIIDPRRTDKFEVDAAESWRLAKILYDAKPKTEQVEETSEAADDEPCIYFDFVIDDLGTYGVYRDGLFVTEAPHEEMDNKYRDHLIRVLKLPYETAIAATCFYVPVVVGDWPKLYEDARNLGARPS